MKPSAHQVSSVQSEMMQVTAKVRTMLEEAERSCINCLFFDQQGERCGLSNPPMRPPARVIANGCPSFDTIPF